MHIREELRETIKVLPNNVLLAIILVQQTLLDNKLHVLFRYRNLTVAVIGMVQHLCCKLELWNIIYLFLYAEHHAKLRAIAELAKGT